MIEVRRLVKRFGPTVAVDGLDFTVERGEILGFLGPNGAGKTTTLRILTGYFPPTEGTAVVAGHDVVEDTLAARAAIGYLPESVPLYVDMRVEEYLRFVAGMKGVEPRRVSREVERVMEATAITPRRGQLISQLSKGYRQRVGLAQAILGDPPVLILDEPTIGLDPGQIVEIRSLIKGFAGEKTVILSSHILPEVAATCTQVVIINRGRLVAAGSPEVLRAGRGGLTSLRLVAQGPAAAVAELLGRVEGVRSCAPESIPVPEGACAFRLETDEGLAVRAAIARAVVEAGHGLVELSPVSATLEEVFVQLTTEDHAQQEQAA